MEAKTETAETRYFKLLERYPDIIHKIPLKHLSTFLALPHNHSAGFEKKRNSFHEIRNFPEFRLRGILVNCAVSTKDGESQFIGGSRVP